MDEQVKKALRQIVKEMKEAHAITSFWLKGSPIDDTLNRWSTTLEEILKYEEKKETV